MALIDFGMKARQARDCMFERYEALTDDFIEVRRERLKLKIALNKIANSTAKAGSAIRLANIAREALGRPVKGGGEQ